MARSAAYLGSILCALLMLMQTSCSRLNCGYYLVEVAPAKFLPVKFWGPGHMKIKYNGQIVTFHLPLNANKPWSLMEHNGKLYVISFDNTSARLKDHHFLFFQQSGNGFQEISHDLFPKRIAIINIWHVTDPSRFSTGINSERIDKMVLARECDPNDGYFHNSSTARLWYKLESGNVYSSDGPEKTPTKEFLQEYIRKYQPVKLTSMEMKPLPKEQQDF